MPRIPWCSWQILRRHDSNPQETYLNIIHEGSVDEWVYLWKACNDDPETRQAVIDLLPVGDPLLSECVHMWADMLRVPRPELGQSIP